MGNNASFLRHLSLTAVAAVSLGCLHSLPAQATDTPADQSSPAAANPATQAASSFVNTMAGNAIQFLADKSASQEQKKSEFRTLLVKDFDMNTIGRFSLGSYWNSATPTQRAQYQKLFQDMIVEVYSQRFESYNGQKFQVNGAESAGGRDTLVHSAIIPKDSPQVNVDWRVRNENGQYKVVDVVVEGVSMAVTQRSDFSSVIQRGGGNIQVLLNHLQHPDANDAALPVRGQAQ